MNGPSWDFTLANYDAVWAFMVQFGLLLFFLMVGNILRRKVKIFRTGQVPSALLGGALVTYVYIRKVAKECFKGFEHEFFLMSFGTMTGTASNGMIMMKEIDPGLHTPTSSLYILSNFPAMIMIAPLLFMLGFASKSLTNALIALAVFFVLWIGYTVYLFRRRIFRKKYANMPVVVWEDENKK